MPIFCPKCSQAVPDGARFCEYDGTPLPHPADADGATVTSTSIAGAETAAPASGGNCRCGAGPDANIDGFCSNCGRKWPVVRQPLPRDHIEIAILPDFGGVTDRGQRHVCNEDDFALAATERAAGDRRIILVCDGVSSSRDAQSGSAAAARTACDLLQSAAFPDTLANSEAEEILRDAVAAANDAVCALTPPAETQGDPPETTLVAAVVQDRTALIAWVGDSRAYWIDTPHPEASRAITHDHSWMNDVIDSGRMTEQEASHNRLAHAITRCLGQSDDPESQKPSLAHLDFPPGGGLLLLCTDGLWNYAPETRTLDSLVRQAPQQEGAVGIARFLTAWANEQGGRDNITVAISIVPAVTDTPQSLPEATISEEKTDAIQS